MSLPAAIKSHLLHDSGVALLVDDRVFHMAVLGQRAPKRPYIVLQIIGGDPIRHMENVRGLADADVQITCYGDRDTEFEGKPGVYEVAEAVRKSLDQAHHRTIGRAPDSIDIDGAFLGPSHWDSVHDDDGREWGVFKIIQEWRLVYAQSLPQLAV